MAAPASASATQSPAGPGVADLEDSNVSSPLSEVDDGDTNDDDIERMQLDPRGDDGDNFSASGDERPDAHHDGSDSDSALSDAASDVHSDANDTEAETERLYDTPKNQRQGDVLVDQFNNGQVFEHTPSKLRRTTRAAGDHADDESVSGDDASVVSSHAAGDESPAKPATTNDTSVDEDLKHDSQERKRKRSPLADQSESDQPLRKRTGSVAAADADADEDLPMNEDDTPSAIPMSRQQSGGEDDESGPPSRRDTPAEAEARPAKKSTRSSLKRKGLAVDDVTADVDSDARDDQAEATAGDETEQPEDEPDVDEEADAAAKNIEESEYYCARPSLAIDANLRSSGAKECRLQGLDAYRGNVQHLQRQVRFLCLLMPHCFDTDSKLQALQGPSSPARGGGAVPSGRRTHPSGVSQHEEVHRRSAQ